MNAIQALRRSDPARRLDEQQLAPRSEDLLRQIVTTPAERPEERVAPQSPGARARRDRPAERHPVLITLVVAAVVAALAVVAIRSVPPVGVHRVPATTPTASATTTTREQAARLRNAVFARLPQGARSAPALTWSDATDGAQGEAIDMVGRTLLLAAACEGGGSLTITVSRRPDTVLDCSRRSRSDPIDLSAATGEDPPGTASFDVRVSSGHPRFFAVAAAVKTKDAGD